MKNFIYFIFLILGILMGSFISLISSVSPIAVNVFLASFLIISIFNLINNKQLRNFKDFYIQETCFFVGIWIITFRLETSIQVSVLIFNIFIFLIGYYSKYKGEKVK